MDVIIDTREQLPLEFNSEYIGSIVRETLNIGDYAVRFTDGTVPPVRFERKSLCDLFGTLSQGYKRFKKEIIRAREEGILLVIIIEENYSKVLKGHKYSKRNGEELAAQLWTLMIKHGVPFVCCKNREEMSRYITDCFVCLGKRHVKLKKEKKLEKNNSDKSTD